MVIHCGTKVLGRTEQSRFTIDRIVNLFSPRRDTIPWSYKPNSELVLAKFCTNAALISVPRSAERTGSPVSHDTTSRHCRNSGLIFVSLQVRNFGEIYLDPPKEETGWSLVHLRRFLCALTVSNRAYWLTSETIVQYNESCLYNNSVNKSIFLTK